MNLIESFRKIIPGPSLRSDVEYFWALSLKKDSDFVHRMIPESAFEIILQSTRGTFQRFNKNEKWVKRPLHFVGGLFTKSYEVKCTEDTDFIGVRFFPGKAHYFLRENLNVFNNSLEDLTDIFKKDFANKLNEFSTVETKIRFLQDYLLLNKVQKSDTKIDRALHTIHSTNKTLIDISSELKISQSYMRKRFSEYVGISPKNYKKIMRINNVLRGSKKLTLPDSIYSNDYFDYSHFVKDFRSITNTSPKSYFKNDFDLIKYFQN